MPYLFLALAILLGLYGLYRLFIGATPKQIVAVFLAVMTAVVSLALFILAVTGRLPGAIAILSALLPFGLAWWRGRHQIRKKAESGPAPAQNNMKMSRAEALDILGLSGHPGPEEISEAYKRLMMKVHPDQQGTTGLAARLNEARDFLMKSG